MANDGVLSFDTRINTRGFQNGVDKLIALSTQAAQTVTPNLTSVSAAASGIGAAFAASMAQASASMAQGTAAMNAFLAAVQQMSENASGAAEQTNNATNSIASGAKNALGYLAKAAAAVTTAFTAASAAAIKVGSDFEASMSQVAATMGITADTSAFDTLSEAAKEMGETTKFSASQAGEALNYLALAGYNAEKAVAALPTVLNVAAAGGMELAAASDMVTDAMSALGLETSQMSDFADKLAVTSQKSNTSVAQLGEAILTVGGTAKSLTGGVTELNTALGILADNGIKGSEGGTMLRNVILSLSAPTDKAAGAIARLGVTAFDTQGNLRPLQDVFYDLNTALSSLSQQEQNAVLTEIFNKEDLKGVNALLGTSAERFDELSGYISDCAGAAEGMAETMNDNLQGDLTILGSALEGLGVAAYEKFQVPMRTAVQSATEEVGKLTASLTDGELSDSMETVAEGFGKLSENIISFAANDVVPVLLNAFSLIVEHGNEIISMAVGVGTAFVAWKAINNVIIPVINVFEKANISLALLTMESGAAGVATTALSGKLTLAEYAVGLYTGKITLATTATGIFKKTLTAITANPIIALIAVLGTAVAGAVALKNTIDEAAEEIQLAPPVQGFITEMNKVTEAIKEQRKEFDELKASQQEKQAEDESEINNLQRLWSELQNYVDENGKVISDNKRAAEIISLLNDNYDMNISYINGQIEGYSELSSSMDGYIEKLRNEARIRNQQPVYDEAVQRYDELQTRYDQLQKLLSDSEAAFQAATDNGVKGIFAERCGAIREQMELLKTEMMDCQTVMEDFESLFSFDIGGTSENKSSQQMRDEEYAENYTATMQETARKNTEELQKKWKQADHDYAIGAIATEEELYQAKLAIWQKYGSESNTEHWSYLEDLRKMEKDFADQSTKDAEKAAEKAAKNEEKARKDKWDGINRREQMGLLTEKEALEEREKFFNEYFSDFDPEKDFLSDGYEYFKQIYDDKNALAKAATEEEKQIFKDKWESIDRLEQVGLMTEEEALKKRKELFNEYYPDFDPEKDCMTEAYEYHKQIYDDETALTEEEIKKQEKIVDDGLSDILSRYQKAYDEMEQKRENYRKKLLSIGGNIFSVEESEDENGNKTKTYTVNNIDEQIKKMREYHAQIKKLKEQDISDGLLEELTSMNSEDSVEFTKYLSGMSDAEFKKINDLYKKKDAVAEELSNDLYKSEAEKISENMNAELAALAVSAYDYGAQSAEQFSKGFNEAMDASGIGKLQGKLHTSGAETSIDITQNQLNETAKNAKYDVSQSQQQAANANKAHIDYVSKTPLSESNKFTQIMGKYLETLADISNRTAEKGGTSTVVNYPSELRADMKKLIAAAGKSGQNTGKNSDIERLLTGINKPVKINFNDREIAEIVIGYQDKKSRKTGG